MIVNLIANACMCCTSVTLRIVFHTPCGCLYTPYGCLYTLCGCMWCPVSTCCHLCVVCSVVVFVFCLVVVCLSQIIQQVPSVHFTVCQGRYQSLGWRRVFLGRARNTTRTQLGSSGLLATLNARPGRLTGLPGLGSSLTGWCNDCLA